MKPAKANAVNVRLAALICLSAAGVAPAAEKYLSHPPLRKAPPAADRPRAQGPAYFVDARRGDDGNDGGEKDPWRTVARGLRRLKAGDTLYLRGGVYYERLTLSLHGTEAGPVTIRSWPGELAVLDGGLREFFQAPAECWEPVAGGRGEFRSRAAYPNGRAFLGWFGDSMVGLQTYHHAADLRADNELWDWQDPGRPKETDVKPVYCGPGLWYDPANGRLHCRLAPTHLPRGPNYRGVTDPRQVPLVVAPFRAVPLHLDGARHVRLQDLVIRGGGHDTVVLDQCGDVELDNVTVWAGTYGLRLTGVQRLKLTGCGVYGGVPPWTFRADASLRSYPGRPHRDITRLGTHALLVPEAGREFSVYAYPLNDDWEIARCDFGDAHDGVYLGGVNVRFHHNRVHNLQDDGIYLSPMYPRLDRKGADVHLYQNHLSRCLTALAFGGPELVNRDQVWIYRNVIDLREPVATGRPSSANPKGGRSFGQVMGDHGSPPWPAMKIYHNTFVTAEPARGADMGLLGAVNAERPRFFVNNVLVHQARLPPFRPLPYPDVGQADGNLYSSPAVDKERAAAFFARYRASAAFERSKQAYPPGFEANSLVADPLLAGPADYRPLKGSPAINAGVDVPDAWPDPLRRADAGKADVGALPLGTEILKAGRRR